MIRTYGVEGLRAHVRNHCRLAKRFARLVAEDDRFEVCNLVRVGLVCFRLIGASDELNCRIVEAINASRRLHLTPGAAGGRFAMRYAVCNPKANEEHIGIATLIEPLLDFLLRVTSPVFEDSSWQTIVEITEKVLQNEAPLNSRKGRPVGIRKNIEHAKRISVVARDF